MRLGFTPNGKQKLTPFETLDFAEQHGFDGVQFGTPQRLSATSDVGELRAIHAYAALRGQYADVSVNRLNPHTLRGDQSAHYAGVRAEIQLWHQSGYTRMRAALGSLPDRYRTDPSWPQQLRDSAAAIKREIAPLLRDLGLKLAIENHGDATVRELVRLIEDAGPDVLGICLDTANLFLNLEDPLAAAAHAAPYVLMMHAKDGILFFAERGIARQVRPAGKGAIDWPRLLNTLADANPHLDVTIEDHRDNPGGPLPYRVMEIFRDEWLAFFPDLDAHELASLSRLAYLGTKRLDQHEIPPLEAFAGDWDDDGLTRLLDAGTYLRGVIEGLRSHPQAG